MRLLQAIGIYADLFEQGQPLAEWWSFTNSFTFLMKLFLSKPSDSHLWSNLFPGNFVAVCCSLYVHFTDRYPFYIYLLSVAVNILYIIHQSYEGNLQVLLSCEWSKKGLERLGHSLRSQEEVSDNVWKKAYSLNFYNLKSECYLLW